MDNWNKQIYCLRYENHSNFKAMKHTFYSQYSQDRSLAVCIFKNHKNGIFMDVGAHDGLDLNNTLYFETTHNWTGINVEPIKSVYERLVTNRPNCININAAVFNEDKPVDFIENTGYTEMLSGIKSEFCSQHLARISGENTIKGSISNVITVDAKRIETICDEHNIKNINYLSIDIEGGESNAIRSINFDKLFIDVIGFENNYPDSKESKNIVSYLQEKGYILLPQHIADIFMIHKDSPFFSSL